MQDFADHIQDLFSTLGEIHVRKMFGGYGVYCDGVMFALLADDALYLKADRINQPHFDARGLAQFTYDKKGKQIGMSYFLAPDEIFDDQREAFLWGRRSYEAALRSRSGGG